MQLGDGQAESLVNLTWNDPIFKIFFNILSFKPVSLNEPKHPLSPVKSCHIFV